MDFYYTITVKSTNVSVTSVTLSQSSINLKERNTYQLSASVYPTDVANKNVNWSSSNTSATTFSNSGSVTAKTAGTATITCSAADSSGRYATCNVSVEAATVYVSSITLSETAASLYVGDTTQLNATVSLSSVTNKSVGWTSDDTPIATVSPTGLVTAKSAGTATITCKAKDESEKQTTCSISVKENVKPTAITLSASRISLSEGETLQLTATVSPSGAVDKTMTWMSDNTTVATVDNNGLVTAKSTGTANIIATTSNNLAAACAITVNEKIIEEPTVWSGIYRVASSHMENNPSRKYQDGFEMTIAEKDGYYITSRFDEDLTEYYNGGLCCKTMETVLQTLMCHNILRYTDNNSPLYAIYVFDEAADDWVDSWTLKMNEDGTIIVGDFYVATFIWVEYEEKWKNGLLEALYYRMIAKIEDVTDILETVVESPSIHIESGTVWIDGASYVPVYKDNGIKVYSGKTNRIDNLSKGLYIVRIENQSKKILIK